MASGLFLLFLGGFVFPPLFKLTAANRDTDKLSFALFCGAAVLWLAAAFARPAAFRLGLICVASVLIAVIVVRVGDRATPPAGDATPEA